MMEKPRFVGTLAVFAHPGATDITIEDVATVLDAEALGNWDGPGRVVKIVPWDQKKATKRAIERMSEIQTPILLAALGGEITD